MARRWTDQTDAEARTLFDSFSEREIRRRQDLCRQQKAIAYRDENADALADLERMETALTESMLRRCTNA